MPNNEQVSRALELIKKGKANHDFFFARLSSASWLDPLANAGLFSAPPQAENREGWISFPAWPEASYLARVASKAPERVLEIMMRIDDTDNQRVHEDLAVAATQLSGGLAAVWARREAEWLTSTDALYLLLPQKLTELVVRLAEEGEADVAFELASALLRLRHRLEPTQPEESGEYRFPPSPRARFGFWHYKQSVADIREPLVRLAGERAIDFFADVLSDAIDCSHWPESRCPPDDSSLVWKPLIGEDDRRWTGESDLPAFLTAVLRDAALQQCEADTGTSEVVASLWDRPWNVMRRVCLHLLRVVPDAVPAGAGRLAEGCSVMLASGLWPELGLLLREHFDSLPSPTQQTLLACIDEGPDLDRLRAAREAWLGEAPTEDEIAEAADAWRWRRLGSLEQHLTGEHRLHLARLVERFGPPPDPGKRAVSTANYVGWSSPKNGAELEAMSPDELIEFLSSWAPEGGRGEPSAEGLAATLKAIVTATPEKYSPLSSRFVGLSPPYVRGFIEGICEAVKAGSTTIAWGDVLALCSWVVAQPIAVQGYSGEYPDLDPGWVWTRDAVAELLGKGLQGTASEIPAVRRDAVWDVLEALTADPSPTPEQEERLGGTNMDPLMLSLNTTRGKAFHAVMEYLLWTARAGETGLAPEAREVLEQHLDPRQDPSEAIRAVYGNAFPQLLRIDEAWATQNVAVIFPAENAERARMRAAWEAYLRYQRAYFGVFHVLEPVYSRAVDDIGQPPERWGNQLEPDRHLAEHLMALYWNGEVLLGEEGLVARFFARAPDELRRQALAFLGRILGDTSSLSEEVRSRLKALLEYRLRASQAEASELAGFGWWFASGHFRDAWGLSALEGVLRRSGDLDRDDAVVEVLGETVTEFPLESLRCLGALIEGLTESWRIQAWRDAPRVLLSVAVADSNPAVRQAATDLVHRLGALGYQQFGSVLTETD